MGDKRINHIDEENFSQYGQVISMPHGNGDASEAAAGLEIYHGVLGIMNCDGPVQIGMYYSEKRSEAICQLERHKDTQELLFAVDGAFIVPAAISENGGCDLNPGDVNVFLVKQGEGILFNRGIWHTSPIPADESCTVMVAFRYDTPNEDKELCDCLYGFL